MIMSMVCAQTVNPVLLFPYIPRPDVVLFLDGWVSEKQPIVERMTRTEVRFESEKRIRSIYIWYCYPTPFFIESLLTQPIIYRA